MKPHATAARPGWATGSAAAPDLGVPAIFWIDRLASLTPTRLPQADLFAPATGAPATNNHHPIDLERWVAATRGRYPEAEGGDLVIALAAVYLARVSLEPAVVLGYDDRRLAPAPQDAGPSLGFVPFHVTVDLDQSFAEIVTQIQEERQAVGGQRLPTTILDHPELETAREIWAPPLPVGVVVADRVADRVGDQPWPAAINLVVTPGGDRCAWHTDGTTTPELSVRLVAHLTALAEAVAAAPDQPLRAHAIVPADERQLVERTFNQTQVDYPFDGGLIARFERLAADHPDQPAVVFQGESLTYAAFNQRVNRLAHHLRTAGIGRDQFVGLCMERSIELVVAIWAILKAGGAYVPFNVEDPAQRLADNIADAGVGLLLTQEKLRQQLPEDGCPILTLHGGADGFTKQSADNPSWEVAAGDLAYMIYTSGSTGKPKGVLIEHGAIFNRIVWMQATYQLTADDRVLQKTPYSFDVSVWEFLWPLSTGATLVVAEPGGHAMPGYLADLMRTEAVTVTHFVPSMLRLFLVAPQLEELPLRMVFCSGEALPYELQESFLERTRAELHNLYGPTEAAVDVSFWQCRNDQHHGRVPIGQPIANIQLHVLDETLQSVPVGTPGELHIGGIGLARGYWNRPELTAERFVPNPFDGPDGRLYKTGDLARFLPDGNLEYLGRNDHQVKVNGLRIELGEIEAAIRAHPGIRDTVVIAREVGASKALAGYLVAEEPGEATLDALEAALHERLPAYMVPRTFTFLDAIPLTTSGKVDRKALPDPD